MPRLPALISAVAVSAAAPVFAADSFWLPLPGGAEFDFLSSGSFQNSLGEAYSWGPAPETISVEAIDRLLLGQQVDRAMSNGVFLQRTPAGWFQVADGDPTLGGEYDYYIDLEPFFLEAPMEVGETLAFSGQRRGQWRVPGDGFETWSGTWTVRFTHIGHGSLTTPLGSFDNVPMLRVESTNTLTERSRFPDAGGGSNWDEIRWFDTTRGLLRVQGSGGGFSDFNGDGIADYWYLESQVMDAVPEPAPAALLAAGLLALALLRRRAG
jgi:hypothetical protein